MKTKILLFLTILSLMACSNDDTATSQQKLPPATTTGANTFGCLIDGKVLLPRSGNTSQVNPRSGMKLYRGYPEYDFDYFELEVRDYKSNTTSSFTFHMHNAPTNGIGIYNIDESNGMTDIDGFEHNYIHCTLFNSITNSYQKYISYENSGTFTITRLSPGTETNPAIISGIFNCKLKNINDLSDQIEITDGRFDINSLTVALTYFP